MADDRVLLNDEEKQMLLNKLRDLDQRSFTLTQFTNIVHDLFNETRLNPGEIFLYYTGTFRMPVDPTSKYYIGSRTCIQRAASGGGGGEGEKGDRKKTNTQCSLKM